MRTQRRPLRASILLAFTFAAWPQHAAAANNYALVKREPLAPGTQTTTASLATATALTPLDPKDLPAKKEAPVDGKDGRPHEGPFVETAAERHRKETGDDTPASAGKKTGGKESSDSSSLPESNAGVMDDKLRSGPKDGQRGTEGGITEKTKDKAKDKKPEAPTEAPDLPHSEEKKIKGSDKTSEKDDKAAKGQDSTAKSDGKAPISKEKDDKPVGKTDAAGLSKPAGLPDKPHDIPHPIPIGSDKQDPLKVSKPLASTLTPGSTTEEGAIITPFHSFVLSFTMIIFSEIGDKTFLVAALMAMKYPPLFVFSAALPALAVMTVGSAIMGHAAPMLLPPRFTNFAAAILFLVFGAKMLKEGREMSAEDGIGEEMREVESEIEEKEAEAARFNRRNSNAPSPWALESGRKARVNSGRLPAPPDSPPDSPDSLRARSPVGSGGSISTAFSGAQNLFSLLLSPAWVQTFVMTFLGEWGDRSQIATIAMAAGQNYWWVTVGALTGHSICTGIAVIGGRAIAGRVSMRTGKHSTVENYDLQPLTLCSDTRWCCCLPRVWYCLLGGGLLLQVMNLEAC